jgi:hypothetical protein
MVDEEQVLFISHSHPDGMTCQHHHWIDGDTGCVCVCHCMHACLDCESRIAILMQRMFILECDQVWMESGDVQVIGGLDSIQSRVM